MKQLISIIVPIYNAEKYLERCLNSLRNQTYTNLEILLIDDGSNDNSASICLEFVNSDERFRYYYQENKGVSAARNCGLKLSNGEYVGFCDGDDWIDEDMYEVLLNLALDNNADISICSIYRDYLYQYDKQNGDEYKIILKPREAIAEMNKGELFAGHLVNKLCKRSVIRDIYLNENISMMEDMVFMWEAFHRSKLVAFQNVKKYHYFQISASLSHIYRKSYWSIQEACNCMLKMMEKNYPENLLFARRTVLFGNTILAARISEAGKLGKKEYKLIMLEINRNYSKKAADMLPKGDRKKLYVLRYNRLIFNLYIYAAMKKRTLQNMKHSFNLIGE